MKPKSGGEYQFGCARVMINNNDWIPMPWIASAANIEASPLPGIVPAGDEAVMKKFLANFPVWCPVSLMLIPTSHANGPFLPRHQSTHFRKLSFYRKESSIEHY